MASQLAVTNVCVAVRLITPLSPALSAARRGDGRIAEHDEECILLGKEIEALRGEATRRRACCGLSGSAGYFHDPDRARHRPLVSLAGVQDGGDPMRRVEAEHDGGITPMLWSATVFFKSYLTEGAEGTREDFGPKDPAQLKPVGEA